MRTGFNAKCTVQMFKLTAATVRTLNNNGTYRSIFVVQRRKYSHDILNRLKIVLDHTWYIELLDIAIYIMVLDYPLYQNDYLHDT